MNNEKNKSILIRISESELTKLKQLSLQSGFKNMSEYVRYKLLKVEDTSSIIKRLEIIEDKLD